MTKEPHVKERQQPQVVPTRDHIFLSHANPEDNVFTLWLALQLAKEGYAVWCDLTKFLGGEETWSDIEKVIRNDTLKFIFVVSKTSNSKRGPLKELTVAENVARDCQLEEFIIPVWIDDLPPREFNIQLTLINAINFKDGWARGLKALLEKLETIDFPKNERFTPAAVASWWRSQFDAEDTVLVEPDEYLSNWFAIEDLPTNVYFHVLWDKVNTKPEVKSDLPYPAFQHNNRLITFAKADDFAGRLGESVVIADTHEFKTQDLIQGKLNKDILPRKESRDFVVRLLRVGWELMLKQRKLPTYELANDVRCFYFTKGLADHNAISFRRGTKTFHRQVVGYRTVTKFSTGEQRIENWHFGIQAKSMVYPALAFGIKPHVIFTDDGTTPWESKKRMHSARRRQCRSWWNDEWRDRILAAMTWLSDQTGRIEVALGRDISIRVSNMPLTFTSPVSYLEPEKKQTDEMIQEEFVDEDYDEEDDEEFVEGENAG